MPRLGVHVDLPDRLLHNRGGTHPYHEMMVGGKGVVVPLLRQREIPMCVQPVRIARGQPQLPGPVSLRQRCLFVCDRPPPAAGPSTYF